MSKNDEAMADLARLPDADYIHVSSIDNPIGSDRSWKFEAMRKILHRAEKAEKQRDNLIARLRPLITERGGAEYIREGIQAAIASVNGD